MTYKQALKSILLLLPLLYTAAFAQQKEGSVSISCYVNPQLYLQAGVIAQVSDSEGNISCTGKYVSIKNKSQNNFYYKLNTHWIIVKPQGSAVVMVPNNNSSSESPSVLKLNVRYSPDSSSDIDSKIRAIAQMNAQTDRAKAGDHGGDLSNQQEKELDKPTKEAPAMANKPSPKKTSTAPPAKTTKKDIKKEAVVKAKPKTPSKATRAKPEPARKREVKNSTLASANAVGLRIDLGTENTGVGLNFKHRFNRSLSVDAAIVFFEGDVIGLEGQFEHNFPVRKASGLELYIGIGPQFLFKNEDTSTRLVPVAGIEYYFPNAPLNFSLDWRPAFHLSNDTDVDAGRFGLSLRYSF